MVSVVGLKTLGICIDSGSAQLLVKRFFSALELNNRPIPAVCDMPSPDCRHDWKVRQLCNVGVKMFTADQLVAHVVGDYLLQSEWMAREKTRRSFPALVHCVFYLLPFLFITQNPMTLAVIGGTHFVIDRWHLARYIAWLKNRPWPGSAPWSECTATGFHPDNPAWLSGWLVIVIDNILHVLINGLAIARLG